MIAVIGDRETVIGFRLAGVRTAYEAEVETEPEPEAGTEAGTGEVSLSPQAEAKISQLLERLATDGTAIIIINERLAAQARIQAKIRAINENKRGVIPIIVEIPDKRGPVVREISEIERLIKRAVGIALK